MTRTDWLRLYDAICEIEDAVDRTQALAPANSTTPVTVIPTFNKIYSVLGPLRINVWNASQSPEYWES